MTIYFGSDEIVDGTSPLRFGYDVVKKLYYKDELIYQNILPSGTILWQGNLIMESQADYGTINLNYIDKDWTNVLDKVLISTNDYSNLPFNKNDLLTRQNVGGGSYLEITRISGTNEMEVRGGVGRNIALLKIVVA